MFFSRKKTNRGECCGVFCTFCGQKVPSAVFDCFSLPLFGRQKAAQKTAPPTKKAERRGLTLAPGTIRGFASKPAKAPVLAQPSDGPAKATCGWFWCYLLTPEGSYSPRRTPRLTADQKAAKKSGRRSRLYCFLRPKSTENPAARAARRQAIRKKIWDCVRLALSLTVP